MTNAIETYLNSLSEDLLILDIGFMNIKSLPDLTRFKNLKTLYCSNNELTSLPSLPQKLERLGCSSNQLTALTTLPPNLVELYCSNNQLTSLPTLPPNLVERLDCYDNELTSLPTLPQKLEILYCSNNELTSLPTLPQNLQELRCYNNQLTSLPTLPQKLETLDCGKNPIFKIVKSNTLVQIKKNIQILNNFRHLYYCLIFKKQLRKWLWEKVREPNIKKMYSPMYLIDNLKKEEDDLDAVLDNWK